MLAKVLSGAVLGIDAYRVEVEVDINPGLPTFATVGLPEAAVKESKERVKSAIGNSGYRFPDDRITVNLAPADIKKEGTGFDLPIALGILAATGIIPQQTISRYLILGELSLDGRVKAVRGSLPMALAVLELPAGDRLEEPMRNDFWTAFSKPQVRNFISKMCAGYQGTMDQLPQLYTRIACPTLVVWAEHDKHFPLVQAERLQQKISCSQLEVIPNGTHWMVLHHAERLAKCIIQR